MSFYVDVHTHLTHELFETDWQQVIERAKDAGLGAIVVNGLEPVSNRKILDWAIQFGIVKPALGIYPLDSINGILPRDFPYEIAKFDVDDEISFIRDMAKSGRLAAIGECGLDQYYLGPDYLPPQERVFEQLIDIAVTYDLPLIIHTRKAEVRAGEILAHMNAKKVNFHCFGGRTSLAKKYSEVDGWWFSIPANCSVNEAFQKMLKILPLDKILTETDAPYLPPKKGDRNEPSNVVGTVAMLAKFRNITESEARDQVYRNYLDLFA
ncbi:MAG: TatD family hydrolase, partial [Proteobacteria bacterium]|nr:TatD family hydrolase [Pseudomonadota bacterium]